MNSNFRLRVEAIRSFLVGLSRPAKSSIVATSDLIGFGLSAWLASWLIGFDVSSAPMSMMAILGVALISIFIAWRQGLYRAVVRYIGADLVMAGGITAALSALVGATLMYLAEPSVAPLRWAVTYWAFTALYVCSSRFFARLTLVKRPHRRSVENVVIYGAGAAGAQLAISLQSAGEFIPVAMVDDDRSLHGKKVSGLIIYSPQRLEALIAERDIQRVLLAIPSASRRKRRQVLERISEFPVHVQTMPHFKDIVSGKARVDDIRDVDVVDLLGRDAVPPNPELLDACIRDKSVMVTGAGGSIGSELCRQILRLSPLRLVLFEISESALYETEKHLRQLSARSGVEVEIVPLLGSVHHEERVRQVMEAFGIHTVYHAAAYKHVPIVEQNLFEGIHNNVFGTLHAVRAAIAANVETFVLISTDKAVNPTSVMGATKRFAELILQAGHQRGQGPNMCMVRFGNVLESSGSVVPLFNEQIRNGGPVTVTHRDIIRYFMTIPEAAQLVLQAGSMARGGDVFVLDMGDPVRIQDLAYRMINLMGLTVSDDENPDGDIEIQYIGLRPAEKLYEELLIGANVSGTDHPRIMRADEDSLPIDSLNGLLDELLDASLAQDHNRTRDVLLRAVKEYRPSNGIDDLVWVKRTGTHADSDVVVEFPSNPTQ